MGFDALAPLVDRAALFAAVRQDQLSTANERLGPHRWEADMAAGRLAFIAEADPGRRVEMAAHLIATIAPGPRSLLWAWAHPQGDPDGVAAGLRDYGAANGIAELTTPEIPFPADTGDGLAEWIAQTAHVVGMAAVWATGRSPYYSAPAGGGTRAVFLLDAPLPVPSLTDVAIVLPRMLAGTPLRDGRAAVWGLAQLAHWRCDWVDGGLGAATLNDGMTAVTFRFDDQGRVAGIEGTMRGGGPDMASRPAE